MHLQLDEALAKMQALIVPCSLGNREFVCAACVLPAILLCACVQRGSHHGAGVALAVAFSKADYFLKKLWCCVGGGVIHENLVYQQS